MPESIHPNTRIGAVALTISNLDRSLSFYQDVLGFQVQRRTGDTAHLGAGGPDLLVLTQHPGAVLAHGTTGLHHFAILVPSRLALALALRHLGETRTPLQESYNHWCSESIYVVDPDGNDIEIYRDCPRSEWLFEGAQLRIDSVPLDLEGLLSELSRRNDVWSGLPPETVIGHVNLRVANLAEAEAFYVGVLGFDMMARYETQAVFVSAGGYHGHVGLNTWEGVDVPPPPPGSIGLRHFDVRLPNTAELDRVKKRVRDTGVTMEETPAGVLVLDPSANAILLTASTREKARTRPVELKEEVRNIS
jgi:catechol 2,3-dioxygenase